MSVRRLDYSPLINIGAERCVLKIKKKLGYVVIHNILFYVDVLKSPHAGNNSLSTL